MRTGRNMARVLVLLALAVPAAGCTAVVAGAAGGAAGYGMSDTNGP